MSSLKGTQITQCRSEEEKFPWERPCSRNTEYPMNQFETPEAPPLGHEKCTKVCAVKRSPCKALNQEPWKQRIKSHRRKKDEGKSPWVLSNRVKGLPLALVKREPRGIVMERKKCFNARKCPRIRSLDTMQ